MNPTPGEAQVSVLQTIEGDEELRKQWNALVLQMETPQIFFTYEWALAVARAFKSIIQPRIFTFTNCGTLIGVAALACDVSDQQKLFFLGASTGDYCDVVCAPRDRAEVIHALFKEFGKLRIKEAFLASIPQESATLRVLAEAKGVEYWSTTRPAYTCRRILFDRAKTDPTASKPVKTERLRRLAKLGEVNVEHLSTCDRILLVLDSVIKVQIARFLVTTRLSPLLKLERRKFLTELTRLLSPEQKIDLTVLKLNDRGIAWHFGFQFEGVLSWYLPTFDSSLEAHSPGACLLNLVNDENRNKTGLKEIDLGLGDESYKEHFANTQRETFNVHLSASFVGHIKTLLRNVLAKVIKNFPRVEQLVRSALGRINAKSSKTNLLKRFCAQMFSSHETIFYELADEFTRKENSCRIQTLDAQNLAELALQNENDAEMLDYLRQTSPRIRLSKKKALQGFVVQESDSSPVQYFWVDESIAPDDKRKQPFAVIFDYFTPAAVHGKYAQKAAIECVATEIKKLGKTPWISVKLSDQDTLQALDNSSFMPRYSIVRRKFIFSMPSEKRFFKP